ncbi:MAG: threonine transporter [Myxococcales bacterium]|nr:threonine transporter [Myxococcales bacterium]
MTTETPREIVSPFNGPVEIGLRALCVLTTAFPAAYPLQRLVVFDYFLVHSDDIEGGPEGLHPRTPHRGGEILVRRGVIQQGLGLYESRGLIERVYEDGGIYFAATDKSADFLDTVGTEYLERLRDRADWVVSHLAALNDTALDAMVRQHVGTWGAEFATESVLWTEELS